MRKLILILITFMLSSCGGPEIMGPVDAPPDPPGVPGEPGEDGEDGEDGGDAVTLNTFTLLNGECTEVYDNIWAENISNGYVFDLYYNSNCADAQGEYCDNVATSYGASGNIDPGQGSSTVCWIGNVQFSGVRLSGGDIKIYILDFKTE